MDTTHYENTPKYRLQALAMACLGLREITPAIQSASREELVEIIMSHPQPTGAMPPDLRKELDYLTDSVKIISDLTATLAKDNDRRFNSFYKSINDLEDAITELRKQPVAKEITINLIKSDGPVSVTLPNQHNAFEKLLTMAKARVNSFLVGPAGSGKSTAARNVAKAMDLPFYFNGAIDSEYKLTGFIDAQGRIISKPFREAFINGGVYLFDEVDGSMPQAVLPFNAALANNRMDFPDGCFDAHPDFICIAAGNTFFGPDSHYVGRYKQDGAFLDRFAVLEWSYDLVLEKQMALSVGHCPEVSANWHSCVVALRNLALSKGIQIIASPRATVNGLRLMKEGFSWDEAVQVCLRKSMKQADWDKLADACHAPMKNQPKVEAATQAAPESSSLRWEHYYKEGRYDMALAKFLDETKAKGVNLNNKGVEMIRKIFSERPQINNYTLARIDGVIRSPKCVHRSVTLNGLV
jgi:MoxR-like ATPase